MKKHLLLSSGIFLGSIAAMGQCATQTINGDLIVSADLIMSGTYIINGTFRVDPGVTVFVEAYGVSQCGKLEIEANKVDIQGTINADFAGYEGGSAGSGAINITSVTGDQTALTGCHNKDNGGQITLGGGLAGSIGNGPGAGLAGNNGSVGSGPKQTCGNTSDKFGMVAGSGGAGGGGGASYGGNGTIGGNGGNGSGSYTANSVPIDNSYSVIAGIGGLGGDPGQPYGTNNGQDIDLGSGGAGSGGGGRSFYTGSNGNRGGNGGGAISILASDSLIITGTLSALGENGLAGGNGANGDKTTDCCSDGCSNLGERTFSAGAGAGAGSGAGSGGGILINAPGYSAITGTINAIGGNGGNGGIKGNGTSMNYGGSVFCGSESVSTDAGENGNVGGDGSGGRIKIFTTSCAENIFAPNVGIQGGTTADSGSYYSFQDACIPFDVSTQEFKEENKFLIFPNPASDIVYIKLQSGSFDTQSTLTIFDNAGRMVYTQNIDGNNGNTIQLPVYNFATGAYTMVIQNAKGRSSQKLIKY